MRIRRPKGKDGKLRKHYWIDAWVEGVRIRKSLGTGNLRVADERARKLVLAAERRAAGLDDAHEAQRAHPEDLLKEYEAELKRLERSDKHVRMTMTALRRLLDRAPLLADVTPTYIRHALERCCGKATARTANRYRGDLFAFFKFLQREGRISKNPVENVRRRPERSKKRVRRALSAEEVERLLASAPTERAVVYHAALGTGLRRSELAALRWSGVDLDAKTVTVPAGYTKGRRTATQELPDDLCELLRERHPGPGRADTPVFAKIPPVAALREDLQAAGIPFENEKGEVVDIHALRVTYGTLLDAAGVPLGVRQGLLRHTDPRLTANTYTRPADAQRRAAVAALDFGATKVCPEVSQSPVPSSPQVASRCTTPERECFDDGERKSLAEPRKRASADEEGLEAPSRIELECADLQSAA